MASKASGITHDWVTEWSERYSADAANTPWRPGARFWQELEKYPSDFDVVKGIRNYWELEEHNLGYVGNAVRLSGGYTAAQFLTVCYWKSPRPLRYYIQNKREVIDLQTRSALVEPQPWRRLDSLRGVGIPVASSLLTVWDPAKFTIIDVWALRTLASFNEQAEEERFGAHDQPWWERHYDLYLKGCRTIAERIGQPLREVDRALWKWGKTDARGN